jgi:hypothetical protein
MSTKQQPTKQVSLRQILESADPVQLAEDFEKVLAERPLETRILSEKMQNALRNIPPYNPTQRGKVQR